MLYLNQGSLWTPDANSESKITILPYHYFNFEPYDGCFFFGANLPNVTDGKCTIFFVYGYKEIINLFPDFFDIRNELTVVNYIGEEADFPRPEIECDSPTATWSHFIDFLESDGGFVPLGGSVSTPVWQVGLGWRFIRGGSGIIPEITRTVPSSTFLEGTAEWFNPVNISGSGSYALVRAAGDFGTSAGENAQGYHTFQYFFSPVVATILRSFATTLDFSVQEIYLTGLYYCGSGVNPFIETWEQDIDFTIDEQGFSATEGEYTAAVGWQSLGNIVDATQIVNINLTLSGASTFTYMSVTFEVNQSIDCEYGVYGNGLELLASGLTVESVTTTPPNEDCNGEYTLVLSGFSTSVDEINFTLQFDDDLQTHGITVTAMHFEGEGVNPF